MQRFRIIVLACQWETIPPGTVVPVPIDLSVLQQMFSESPESNWSLADLFVRSTLGQVRFDPALVFDIGALPGTLVDREKRAQLINLARQVANNRGILFGPNDRAVAFINPPPCDAGAYGRQAILDQLGEHTYLAHELGHVIGYDHSFGSDLTGDQNTVYGDPYCIMSAMTFGSTRPQANGAPPGATIPAGLPPRMWVGSGPLASAALTAYHFRDFNTFPNVVGISSNYHSYPQHIRLVALSEAAPSDPVLARVETGSQTFFVEYRASTGWDRGLAEPANPDPGVVIHRCKPSSGTLISFAGRISLPVGGAPRYWAAADDDFQVELIVPPLGSPSEVVVSISGFFGPTIPVPGWFGTENQGAGIAIADINGSGRPDLMVFHLDHAAGGENHGYYRIGWDLDGGGQPSSWSPVLLVPGWFGADNQGAGIAIANINGSGRPDLVVFHLDNPGGENHGHYRIGWDLSADGQPSSWSPVLPVPGWFGADNQGAGIAIADINGSGRPDLVVFHLDHAVGGENHGYYRIGWDLNVDGQPSSWSPVLPVPGWFGADNQGAGIAIADINGSGRPDLVVFHLDNASGENHGYYRVGYDLNTSGIPAAWVSPIPIQGWFGTQNQGADIAFGSISGSPSPDLVVFHIDNPVDENHGYCRIGRDLHRR